MEFLEVYRKDNKKVYLKISNLKSIVDKSKTTFPVHIFLGTHLAKKGYQVNKNEFGKAVKEIIRLKKEEQKKVS